MDWDNVRVFLAVARGGQFVAAAKRLKLDHATVSRRIAALEETVGAKLFDRRTTGAKLTGAGERFIGAAEQMESAFLHAQGEISGVDLELSGDVRIGAPDGFSTYYLVGALRDFAERKSPASISSFRATCASARRTGSRPIISLARCATSPSVIPPCACN